MAVFPPVPLTHMMMVFHGPCPQLAIVTMCDHSTRVRVGGTRQAPSSRILGLLFGTQDGLDAVITDAIELQYEVKSKPHLGAPPIAGSVPSHLPPLVCVVQ